LCQQPSEAAIQAALQKYVSAFNAGDADAAAATYTPDGSHTYALGFTHHGRVEIAQGLRELLAGPMKGGKLSITSLSIRSLAPTIAVEEEAFSVEGLKAPDGQPLPAVKGLCLVVYQQHVREWLAAAVQCMVPAASSPPK
jgi:uncharacterized protein (TIGR02246 family)